MRCLTLSAALAWALAGSAAMASTPSVEIDLARPSTGWSYDDGTIVLPVPPGYCFPEQLTVHYQADSLLVFSLNQWAVKKGRLHLAIAIDCDELAALRNNLARGFRRFIVYSADAGREHAPRRIVESRADYAESVSQAGARVTFTTAAVGVQSFTAGVPDEAASSVTALEGYALGHDPYAAYTAIVQSVVSGERQRTVAGVYAATLIDGIPVTVEFYAPADGAALGRLEEQARSTVAALIAGNPDSEASHFTNINWYRVASGSLFGGAIGGALGLLHKLSRGRRKRAKFGR
jgi:hypothetical protein